MTPDGRKSISMSKALQQKLAFAFGVAFVIAILILAIAFPEPTKFQYTVFRIVLALAAGGVAAMFPGFLSITISNWLRAGGALAVFAIVYFYAPADMVGVKAKTALDLEIEKPLVAANQKPGQAPMPKRKLDVKTADDLMNDGVLDHPYDLVRINGVRAKMPVGSAIVSDAIDGQGGAALVGKTFTIVANRLSNLTLDVTGSKDAGSLFFTPNKSKTASSSRKDSMALRARMEKMEGMARTVATARTGDAVPESRATSLPHRRAGMAVTGNPAQMANLELTDHLPAIYCSLPCQTRSKS